MNPSSCGDKSAPNSLFVIYLVLCYILSLGNFKDGRVHLSVVFSLVNMSIRSHHYELRPLPCADLQSTCTVYTSVAICVS
jgi:hypothetical protein